jgi:uncharacterized protein (TIGR02284 family)
MHRAWTNIKSGITGMSEHAVFASVSVAKMPPRLLMKQRSRRACRHVRTLVERQYQGVKANHDRVRNLRNAAA